MKHEIDIEGLPEGWEPVAIRKQKLGEHIFCLDTGLVVPADHRTPKAHLIVKKKQPRRIVLEETDEINDSSVPYYIQESDLSLQVSSNRTWRIVEDSGENND